MSVLLDLQDLANTLDYFQARFWIHNFQEDSGRTGAGDDLTTDLMTPLWRGEITIDPSLRHAEALAAQARISTLNGVIGRFYMYDPRMPYPIGDPMGTIINAHALTIQIAEISSDRTRVKFKKMPPNYWLNVGDRFHSEFAASPVHRSYYFIVTRIKSDVDGNTGWIDVSPTMMVGQDVNDIVVIARPSPLWRLQAGGFEAGTGQGQLTPGGSLKMWQVL
jgi:hypothetical protein